MASHKPFPPFALVSILHARAILLLIGRTRQFRRGGQGLASLRYDVCVIGAGTEGLAAAIVLARAGLKVIAVERGAEPGGRCRTREFHPGFRASFFSDEMAPIPADIFWLLGLGRSGAAFALAPA